MTFSLRTWLCLCHVSALFGFVVGPLWVWLSKRHVSAHIDREGLESLNFQVSMNVLFVFAFFLRGVFVGKWLMLALLLVDIAFVVVATYNVYKTGNYRYPFNLRLVK